MHAHDEMNIPEPALPHRSQAGPSGAVESPGLDVVHRLQGEAGNAAVGALLQRRKDQEDESPVKDVIESGGGHPLPTDVREPMEQRFGTDFGDVRVHTDGAADASARSVNANAYTVGSNVVFQRDRYNPSSTDGMRTLAHELTHVVQQRQGPVEGTPAPGGIRVSDPSDRYEREADRVADEIVDQPAMAPRASGGAAPVQHDRDDEVRRSFLQRQGEEPDEELQGSFVQRQDEEEPEEDPATM